MFNGVVILSRDARPQVCATRHHCVHFLCFNKLSHQMHCGNPSNQVGIQKNWKITTSDQAPNKSRSYRNFHAPQLHHHDTDGAKGIFSPYYPPSTMPWNPCKNKSQTPVEWSLDCSKTATRTDDDDDGVPNRNRMKRKQP